MAKQGHDVHVFTTNVDGPRNSGVPLNQSVDLAGVNVHYFAVPALRRIYWSPRMLVCLKGKVRDFDIVHTHSVFLWPTWAAARVARAHHVPYVLAPRGMLVRDLVRRRSAFAKSVWIKLIERANIEGAAAIHVTSATESEELRDFSFAVSRLIEIPNGVGAGEEAPSDDLSLSPDIEPLLRSGRPIVLCLGRVHWKKGLDRLIEALGLVPDAVLLVVGNDEENYTERLVSLAKEKRVEDRVVFRGPVFGAAKASLYRRVALLALASYSENFGNVVLEALAEGCPVVVTPEVGASTVVTESGGGIVASGEAQELAGAMRELLASSSQRIKMGERGRDWVRERYSWDAVARQMLAAYEEVIESRRGGFRLSPGPLSR
jgi:glycosyltransferase involved in cell wall biosynthesis